MKKTIQQSLTAANTGHHSLATATTSLLARTVASTSKPGEQLRGEERKVLKRGLASPPAPHHTFDTPPDFDDDDIAHGHLDAH